MIGARSLQAMDIDQNNKSAKVVLPWFICIFVFSTAKARTGDYCGEGLRGDAFSGNGQWNPSFSAKSPERDFAEAGRICRS